MYVNASGKLQACRPVKQIVCAQQNCNCFTEDQNERLQTGTDSGLVGLAALLLLVERFSEKQLSTESFNLVNLMTNDHFAFILHFVVQIIMI